MYFHQILTFIGKDPSRIFEGVERRHKWDTKGGKVKRLVSPSEGLRLGIHTELRQTVGAGFPKGQAT
jgi:hypothetical protein